jgi:hypothetical protein
MKRNVIAHALAKAALVVIATSTTLASAQPWELPAPGQGGRLPLPTIDPDRVRLVAPLPDLIVSEAAVVRMPVVNGYRWNKIGFCVKNVGAGASVYGATVVFANTIIGDLGRTATPRHSSEVLSRIVPALAPGASYCESLNIHIKEGSHPNFFEATANARLIVDRFRSVAESNESNNEFSGLRVTTR